MRARPRVPDPSVNLPDGHPLGEAATLVVGVGVLLAIAFVGVAFFVDLTVWLLPVSLEARLSALSEAAVRQAPEQTSEQASALLARRKAVAQLVQQLAAGWPENPYKLSVRLSDQDAANAFALPGGLIVVTTGLLDQAKSENELAFVLAHELGHFQGRDHLRALGRGTLFGLLLAMAGVSGDNPLTAAPMGLLALNFSRDQERAADGFALGLVNQHYGHVGGSWDLLSRLAVQAQASSMPRLPTFASSHPASTERLAELRRAADVRGYPLQGPRRPAP